MADSKKYNGSTWEHSLRKLGTATDNITTLPADLYADGNNATVGLVGNMSQTGTPTPDNPIQPQECGERTGNLYNINANDVNNGYVNNAQLNQDGTTEIWGSAEISEYIPINGDTAYTFNGIGSYNSPCYALYDENKQLIGAYTYNGATIINFISPNNARYFRFTHIKIFTYAMMVEGTYTSSTMPEFEPYGYKIPISSGGVTTPVYLGEVQTTRKIKKLVLTAQEVGWNVNTSGSLPFFYLPLSDVVISGTEVICTHYSNANIGQTTTEIGIGLAGNAQLRVRPNNPTSYTLDSWKVWLATQYAAGTPVCVWYVLAEPTTSIVNEPLRKIGDYADTVSGISIPTTAGKDTFDVLTTLKPSEVDLTYHGWHDASAKEWDGSEWQ